jgi:hypothetical protein
MRFKLSLLSLVLLSLVLLSNVACVMPPPSHARYQHQAPEPCKPHVQPINYQTIVTSISVNYTYTPKDATAARPWHQGDVLEYLNGLGKANGDTFVAQNGQALNFTFVYTINNDGQDHFTGSLQFSGWGWGYINTFNTQYAYSDTSQMTRDLTDQAFSFIKGGWHDTRSTCPQY